VTSPDPSDDAIETLPISAFGRHLGLRFVSREDGRAVVRCSVGPEHANSRGVAHGGVASALADTACGAAIAYQPSIGNRGVATVSLHVSFLAPARVGDVLEAVGVRRGRGRRVVTCECEVKNQEGDLVAIGVATLRVLDGAT
jgi:uncharacterized protein (TIGR00369 family)